MAKYIEAIEELPEEFRLPVIKAFEFLREELAETVKKSDFEELKAIVRELAEAQKRTEERLERLETTVQELAEAQKRTEERLERLETTVQELAEAQKRTEQRVEELAEAQKRTEQSLESFKKTTEENFNRVWKAIDELAEAQKRTEEEIRKLTKEQIRIKEELGGLSHTIGYRLEDEAFKALPTLLKQDFGITLVGKLKRDFLEIEPQKFIEVNIWGYGKKNGKEYAIIGEAKSQLKKKDIDEFLKKLELIKKYIPKKQFPLLVTYIAHPQVQSYAKEKNLKIYFSYEF